MSELVHLPPQHAVANFNSDSHPTCGTCRWFAPGPEIKLPRIGQCRAVAPVPILVAMKQGPRGPEPAVAGYFPPTAGDCWCGLHMPRAAAEPAPQRERFLGMPPLVREGGTLYGEQIYGAEHPGPGFDSPTEDAEPARDAE